MSLGSQKILEHIDDPLEIYKIILIGDTATGKSSILRRLVDKDYNPEHMTTIGVDFKIKTFIVEDIPAKLQIWDTSGSERFRSITKAYYRGSHAVIITYDITDKSTFENVKTWLEEVDMNIEDLDILKILVGTKLDLAKLSKDPNIVDATDAHSLAIKYDMFFIECSAKNDINIESIFILAICQLRLRNTNDALLVSNTSQLKFKTTKIQDECCH